MRKVIACLVVTLLVTPLLCGQSKKDPLKEDEIDQIREYADRPPDRIKLYIKFVEERTSTIKQLTDDRRAADRSIRIRNLLDEFTHINDELQDNLDEYHRQHADLRKTLKDLVPASEKWVEIIKNVPADNSYDFNRKTAMDSAATLNSSAKDMLSFEEKYFITHKPDKEYQKRER